MIRINTSPSGRTVTAVDGLSFEVGPGRATGFLGPNGAGKTTTLRTLQIVVADCAAVARERLRVR